MIITPQLLWEGYDPYAAPLEPIRVSHGETNDAFFYTLYFNGEKAESGGITRIFTKLYTPKMYVPDFTDTLADLISAKKKPHTNCNSSEKLADTLKIKSLTPSLVLVMDDIEHSVDTFDPSIYLNEGFSVLVVDYAGISDYKNRFTIYPKAFDKANYFLHPESVKETDTPKNSSWYIWQTVAMRSTALAKALGFTNLFMLGIGHGMEMVYKTAYFDDIILAAATQRAGGVVNSTDLQYVASLDSSAYAQHAKCPIFIQVPSNEQNASLDNISALFESAAASGARLSIIERSVRAIDAARKNDPALWFKFILRNISYPAAPKLEPKGSQNKLYYNIFTDNADHVDSVSLFVAHMQTNSAFRNWRTAAVQNVGPGEYLADVEVLNCAEAVYAFVNVRYTSGLTLSSFVTAVMPKALGITAAPLLPKRLVYDTGMGLSAWLVPNAESAEESLSLATGALGLEGMVSATNVLTTFRLADPQYKGADDASMQLMLYTKHKQVVTFFVTSRQNGVLYAAIKEFSGEPQWIKTTLLPSDFKILNGGTLNSWQDVLTFEIHSEEELMLNSLLWV